MVIILLILGISLTISGFGILFQKEVKISPLFLVVLPFWFFIKQMRNWEPEPIYVVGGISKTLLGLLILIGGIALIYVALTLRFFT